VSLRPGRLTPGGFTLVELIVALTLALLVGGAASYLILTAQRLGGAQSERAAAQDNLRAGALIVASELRELGYDSAPGTAASPDLLVAEPARVRYRAMRGLGFTCAPVAPRAILLRAATWVGTRQPASVDSIALFLEGDAARSDDDVWVRARVTGVGTAACADGSPAIALAIGWEVPALGADAVAKAAPGGPVRIFEILEIQSYTPDGNLWLGMRSVSRGEAIQPLLGPLTGFGLRYLDRADLPTAISSEVRTITVELRGRDARVLSGRVALRNMVRP
jgi:prepilin-type N-terminal cleavage/methylation domain-containing protein